MPTRCASLSDLHFSLRPLSLLSQTWQHVQFSADLAVGAPFSLCDARLSFSLSRLRCLSEIATRAGSRAATSRRARLVRRDLEMNSMLFCRSQALNGVAG